MSYIQLYEKKDANDVVDLHFVFSTTGAGILVAKNAGDSVKSTTDHNGFAERKTEYVFC